MWRAIRIGCVGVDRPKISNRIVMLIASGTREWTLNNVPKSHSNKEKESDQTSSAVTLISISVDPHVASFHSDKIHIELSHNLIRFYSKEFRSGISKKVHLSTYRVFFPTSTVVVSEWFCVYSVDLTTTIITTYSLVSFDQSVELVLHTWGLLSLRNMHIWRICVEQHKICENFTQSN